MSPCDPIRDVLPWYANGSLSRRESRQVAAHLLACDACREELAQWMLLQIELRSAWDSRAGVAKEAKSSVMKRTTGKPLARLDVGSFILGFSLGARYSRGRVPLHGDLRLLGRKIQLISSSKEEHHEQQ